MRPQIPTQPPALQPKKTADIKPNVEIKPSTELKSLADIRSITPNVEQQKSVANSKPANDLKPNLSNADLKPVTVSKPVAETRPLPLTNSQKAKESVKDKGGKYHVLKFQNLKLVGSKPFYVSFDYILN